jgi:putative membrane protein
MALLLPKRPLEVTLDRRQILAASAGALAPALLGVSLAHAQAAIDTMKLPILAGGDFATMTSKLALRRSANPQVTNFAKLEIKEQAAVAEAFGSRPGAAGLTPKHAALYQSLEASSDAEFDTMYVKGQLMGHMELLTLHRSYSSRGSDPMAQGASTVAVPSIETHLALLKGIRATSV